MRKGAILEAAKRDTRLNVQASLLLLALCALVLGWNWRYVYNWLLGPFPLEPAMATTDDPREWVRMNAAGLTRTAIVEERTLSILGIGVSTDVSARYMNVNVDGKGLIVKVDDEFSGDIIEGRLEPLPDEVRSQLLRSSSISALHPRLLDGTATYRWDFNLFVLVAGLLTPVGMLLLLVTVWQSGSVYRHSALGPLRKRGEPRSLVTGIEEEIIALGEAASVGPLWVSPNWIVLLLPKLKIYAVEDLCGIGVTNTTDKHGDVKYRLSFWSRDKLMSESIDTTATQAAKTLEGLNQHHPWLIVEDVEDFEMRWEKDRKGTIADVDTRRGKS